MQFSRIPHLCFFSVFLLLEKCISYATKYVCVCVLIPFAFYLVLGHFSLLFIIHLRFLSFDSKFIWLWLVIRVLHGNTANREIWIGKLFCEIRFHGFRANCTTATSTQPSFSSLFGICGDRLLSYIRNLNGLHFFK